MNRSIKKIDDELKKIENSKKNTDAYRLIIELYKNVLEYKKELIKLGIKIPLEFQQLEAECKSYCFPQSDDYRLDNDQCISKYLELRSHYHYIGSKIANNSTLRNEEIIVPMPEPIDEDAIYPHKEFVMITGLGKSIRGSLDNSDNQ